VRKNHLWSALLIAALAVPSARGDGGRVQMHENAGPFVVTLFSVPDTLVTGPADLSVGVEDAATGELVNDANVILTLTKLDGTPTDRIVARATERSMGNGILKSAEINIATAGHWHIAIEVSEARKEGECSMDLMIGTAHTQVYEVWAAAISPLLFVSLFLIHRRRKRKWNHDRLERRVGSDPIRRMDAAPSTKYAVSSKKRSTTASIEIAVNHLK
jgi:hypothetical protein